MCPDVNGYEQEVHCSQIQVVVLNYYTPTLVKILTCKWRFSLEQFNFHEPIQHI